VRNRTIKISNSEVLKIKRIESGKPLPKLETDVWYNIVTNYSALQRPTIHGLSLFEHHVTKVLCGFDRFILSSSLEGRIAWNRIPEFVIRVIDNDRKEIIIIDGALS
jgi:hypothetical protein